MSASQKTASMAGLCACFVLVIGGIILGMVTGGVGFIVTAVGVYLLRVMHKNDPSIAREAREAERHLPPEC